MRRSGFLVSVNSRGGETSSVLDSTVGDSISRQACALGTETRSHCQSHYRSALVRVEEDHMCPH